MTEPHSHAPSPRPRCEAIVPHGDGDRRCSRTARFDRDGLRVCGLHRTNRAVFRVVEAPDEAMPEPVRTDVFTCPCCGQIAQAGYELDGEAVCGFCRGVGPDGRLTGKHGQHPPMEVRRGS